MTRLMPSLFVAAEDHHVVGGAGEGVGVGGRDQDGAALGRVGADQGVEPGHAVGVQGVGFVEDQGRGVADQGRGDGQALALAGVEAAAADGGLRGQARHLQDLRDAGLGDAAGGRVELQVGLDGAARVDGVGVQGQADLADRGLQGAVGAAAEQRAAAAGFELDHQAQNCGLSGSGRPEQGRHLARIDVEGDLLHGAADRMARPAGAGQLDRLDHRDSSCSGPCCRSAPARPAPVSIG